jgi:hypothetical protein
VLHFIMLFCHSRKLKRRGSLNCHSSLISLIWHPVTSSYSSTWRKNSKGRISNSKTRWTLRWEQFWKQSRFESFPKCLNNESWDCMGVLQVGESMPKYIYIYISVNW